MSTILLVWIFHTNCFENKEIWTLIIFQYKHISDNKHSGPLTLVFNLFDPSDKATQHSLQALLPQLHLLNGAMQHALLRRLLMLGLRVAVVSGRHIGNQGCVQVASGVVVQGWNWSGREEGCFVLGWMVWMVRDRCLVCDGDWGSSWLGVVWEDSVGWTWNWGEVWLGLHCDCGMLVERCGIVYLLLKLFRVPGRSWAVQVATLFLCKWSLLLGAIISAILLKHLIDFYTNSISRSESITSKVSVSFIISLVKLRQNVCLQIVHFSWCISYLPNMNVFGISLNWWKS